MSKLTLEQQRLVEDSLWVVNSAMKKQGCAGDKDIRQEATLYMCKCAMRFDPTMGVQWTTYAYKSVRLYIKRIIKRKQKKAAPIAEEDVFDLPLVQPVRMEEDNTKFIVDQIYGLCTPRERQLLTLKSQGYKGREITKMMSCSSSTLNGLMQNIKEKTRSLEEWL